MWFTFQGRVICGCKIGAFFLGVVCLGSCAVLTLGPTPLLVLAMLRSLLLLAELWVDLWLASDKSCHKMSPPIATFVTEILLTLLALLAVLRTLFAVV